jgi:hypothetical protein
VIRAYPDRPVAVAGGGINLHVSTDARRFRITFYRCGTRIERVPQGTRWFPGEFAPPAGADAPWEWPVYGLEIPASWRAGVYVAAFDPEPEEQPVRPDGTGETVDARSARALFVVREVVAAKPLLLVLPLFTYHAYNVADVDGMRGESEGNCLYSGAPWVSLHRPGGGIGGHPWDEVNADVYDRATPRQTFAHWDAKAIAWLERERYAYECCTDLELHDGSVDLRGYRAIVSFGHHEYWTQEMRTRIDAFVAAGGNVAFFGGNTCWFRAEYDPERRALRRAGRWTDAPEWRMTGVSYAYGGGKWIGARPASGYRVKSARHWIFDTLAMRDGDAFGFDERLIGYECDGAAPGSDLDVLADASIRNWPVEDGSGEISAAACATLGVRQNGGTVFTASTVDWARVLYSGEAHVATITRNVLDRLIKP